LGKSDTIHRGLLAAKAEERAGGRRIYAKDVNEYAQAAKKTGDTGEPAGKFCVYMGGEGTLKVF
jgi:hypothetical protein